MRSRPLVLTLAAAATLAACAASAKPTSLPREDVAAIRALDSAYVAHAVAGDWEALAALLTEDAVVMPPNEPAIVGRAANLARYRALAAGSIQYEHQPGFVYGAGDIAWTEGTSTISVAVPGQEQAFTDESKYLWVLERQPTGGWLIERVIWNSNRPAAAPE